MAPTPPNLKQCQACVPGNGPFTIGGEIGNPRNGYRVRCKNKPTVIATEKQVADEDPHGLARYHSWCVAEDAQRARELIEYAEEERKTHNALPEKTQ
jgi:hypothetical protein